MVGKIENKTNDFAKVALYTDLYDYVFENTEIDKLVYKLDLSGM